MSARLLGSESVLPFGEASKMMSPTATDDSIVEKPVGTGPYVMESWDRGQQVVLKANPTYWGEQPSITDVTMKFIPQASTRVAGLQSGEIQLATLIPLEFLVRPSYTIYVSLADEARMAELQQRLEDHTCIYTPYLGITELIADIRYLGEGPVVPEPPGAKEVATVCRKAFCWLDMDRIAQDDRYLFQEVLVHRAGHRLTGFQPPDRYILNLNPHPLPLQMMAPAYRFRDEVVSFL